MTFITSGYNCPKCNAWVQESQMHACNVVYQSTPAPVVLTREDVETIIRLLKDIEYHVRTKR